MYNEAFEREKPSPLHVATLPLYLDYLDSYAKDDENAIATHDDHHAFIGITRHLILKISDICLWLSQSDGPISRALRIRPTSTPYNEMQGALAYILLSFCLAFFVVAFGSYIFLRPARDLNVVDVYRFTHPPAPVRLRLLMEEVAGWCSHMQPALEHWLREHFQLLMDAALETLQATDHRRVQESRQVWANQLSFLKSIEGQQYVETLRQGIAAYRKSWGTDTETTEIIEDSQEILLQLTTPTGQTDADFGEAVADFSNGLRGANVEFSTPIRGFNHVGPTGIFICVVTTLGPRAIIELRKLLQSYLAHGGRKIKLTNGPLSIEASADDFVKVFTPEQIQQLIEPPPKAPSTPKRLK